jgi:diguanylate cyclase (GGDEF)-like protein
MSTEGFRYGRASLRWLIVLIVLLAVMPVFALYLLRLQTSSEQALAEARERAAMLARDGAAAHAQMAVQTRQFLEVVSQVPAVRNALPECNEFLRWVHGGREWVTSIFVADNTGKGLCGSLEANRTLDIGDRAYFREAAKTAQFVMSDVLFGRVVHRPIVVTALPMFEADGRMKNMLIAGIDLLWINKVAAEASAKYGGTLLAIDRNSRVIAYQPSRVESKKVGEIYDTPLLRTILNSPSPTFEAEDMQGVRRIYGIARLDDVGVTVAVGLKRSEVLDPIERTFRRDLLFLILVAAGSIGAALIVAEFGLLRGVRALKTAALRLKAGKMGLRVKLPALVATELQDLAANYNAMTAEFERLAYLDRLTGLPNRRYLERQLSERDDRGEVAGARHQAVLAIDIDGFKPINDSYGHAIGDRVLTAIARRIAAVVDERGMLARVGGDEFVVILPFGAGEDRETARAFGEEIRAALDQPIEVDGMALPVGCSIGIALVPEDAKSLGGGALAIADAALYEAKRAGRNRVIDSAPPLAAEAVAENEARKPHWMNLELSGLW